MLIIIRNDTSLSAPIYPNIYDSSYRHSASDLDKLRNNVNSFTIKAPQTKNIKGIDGVPFQISPLFSSASTKKVLVVYKFL